MTSSYLPLWPTLTFLLPLVCGFVFPFLCRDELGEEFNSYWFPLLLSALLVSFLSGLLFMFLISIVFSIAASLSVWFLLPALALFTGVLAFVIVAGCWLEMVTSLKSRPKH